MRHAIGRPVRVSLAFVVFLIAAIGGCTLLPAPRETARNTFVLQPEPPSSATPSGTCGRRDATLLVNVPREEPGFDTPGMAYLLQPNVMRYYADSRWIDTPARMMGPLLVQAMERAGCWRAVVRAPSTTDADFRLDTEDLVLEQEFFHRPGRVRLAIRAVLVDMRRQSVVGTRRFEALEEAPAEDAFGGATAANRAAGRILPALAAWAGEAVPADGARPATPASP
jgi:cholesterol transport system auxiliary component